MLNFTNYHVIEELHRSSKAIIYRAQHQQDKQAVILKVLNEVAPSPEQVARFRQEYDIIRSLNLPGVIKAYNFESDHHRWFIVLEDFGGESLARLKETWQFTLKEFLQLAIHITEVLGQLHQQNIVHKDLNPSNIVIMPGVNLSASSETLHQPGANGHSTDILKLIDFGISALSNQEKTIRHNINIIEGTVAYMSPEQTGRMNRVVDYRTDFYSLGVTFYELLTGHLPFKAEDDLELVHSHIAKQPTPPHTINPDLPKSISQIIMKLLAKNAEDRYQSAYGLKIDLETCWQQLQTNGQIAAFPLARQDISDKLRISPQLYGRQSEINLLKKIFDRFIASLEPQAESTDHPPPEMILVSGYAGMGKTALVQELHQYSALHKSTQRRVHFVTGHSETEQSYAGLLEATRSLLQQVLASGQAEIETWQQKISDILGATPNTFSALLPELTLLFNLPASSSRPPTDLRHQLAGTLPALIKPFAQPHSPLVLFIDDLQQSDTASLTLLIQLINDLIAPPAQATLLFIGAYRENEVTENHPLLQMVADIEAGGVKINHLHLSSLGLRDVTQLVSDTFHCEATEARLLAEIVREKTNGNPYFVHEFLTSLYAQKLISFNFERRLWEWNLAVLRQLRVMDNVIELMAFDVQHLLPETQIILKHAACIGSTFDLATLATVCNQSLMEAEDYLLEAVAVGLVVPLTDDEAETTNLAYKFAHDQVREVVYSLIPVTERPAIHHRIGELLWQNTPADQRQARILEIVEQLNRGRSQLNTPTEQLTLAELNQEAAHQATHIGHYEVAYDYLKIALEILPADSWQHHYDLTLALYVQATTLAYQCDRLEEVFQWTEVVLSQARTLLDKIKIHEINIQARAAQGRPQEAIQAAIQVLALLGLDLPAEPSQWQLYWELGQTKFLLSGQTVETLLNLPRMTAPHQQAIMRILASIASAAFIFAPTLLMIIALKQIRLSLNYGNDSTSAYAYMIYGVILNHLLGEVMKGCKFGKLALQLSTQFEASRFETKIHLMFNTALAPWQLHLTETLPHLQVTCQRGLETNDYEFAALAAIIHNAYSFVLGRSLAELEYEIASYDEAISDLKQPKILAYNRLFAQLVSNLRQSELDDTTEYADPTILQGKLYDERVMAPLHQQTNDRIALFLLHLHKLILSYLFDPYAPRENPTAPADQREHYQLMEQARLTERYLEGAIYSFLQPLFQFYDSLAHLAVYHLLSPSEQRRARLKVRHNQRAMKRWADHAPMNFQHKYYLVAAEQARVLQHYPQARELFYQAVTLAQKEGFISEAALANELTAKFYHHLQQASLVQHYLSEAYYGYQQWGAIAKVKQLEIKYSRPLLKARAISHANSAAVTSTTRSTSANLDVASVIKAYQAISSEIDLDKLLAKLIKIVIENAGGQRGCLLLITDNQLLIEAEGTVDREEIEVLQSLPLEVPENEIPLLPVEIINYVARTRRSLVLDDAHRHGNFTESVYVSTYHLKSILCTPLVNHGELLGVLYLENNLMTEAFPPARVEMVKLLGTQASIAIANAKAIAARSEQERLQLENEFLEKQSQELAKLNANKDKFFSIVAHDLKGPFQPLLGLSELMPMMADTLKPEDIREMGESINRSAKGIYTLLENLLEWSRMQMGRMEFQPRVFDLKELVNEIIALLWESAATKQITLKTTIEESLWIYADRNMIDAVIRNLSTNALKFTPRDGSITISGQRQPGDSDTEPSEFVQVSVQDTGVGIAKKNLDKLFKIDVTYTTSGTEQEKGTGLGLILSQEMVIRNGGRIWVESEFGEGTAVKFTVPAATPEQLADPETEDDM